MLKGSSYIHSVFLVVFLIFGLNSLFGQEKSKTVLQARKKSSQIESPLIEEVDNYQEFLPDEEFLSPYYPYAYGRGSADGSNQKSLLFGSYGLYSFLLSLKLSTSLIDSLDWNQKVAWISTTREDGFGLSGLYPFGSTLNPLNLGRSPGALEPPKDLPPGGFYVMDNLLMDLKATPGADWGRNPLENIEVRFFYFY